MTYRFMFVAEGRIFLLSAKTRLRVRERGCFNINLSTAHSHIDTNQRDDILTIRYILKISFI